MFNLQTNSLKPLFSLSLLVVAISIVSCENRQTFNDNSFTNQNITANQNSGERTVKYFDLSNLKIKLSKDYVTNVSKEKALSIADDVFNKEYGKKSSGDVVVCENALSWWVIYEETRDEYSIAKNNVSNSYEDIKKWSRKFSIPSPNTTASKNITEAEAFEIAREQFRLFIERINNLGEGDPMSDSEKQKVERKTFDSEIPVACELKNAWRIYYIPRSALKGEYPHDGAPNYLIDKRTGEILFDSRKRWGIID